MVRTFRWSSRSITRGCFLKIDSSGRAKVLPPFLGVERNVRRYCMSAYDGRFSMTFARLRFSAWIAFAAITLPSFLCLSSASAQQFVVAPEYATGHVPQFAASGDFNGDGKTDLVTSNVLANTVSVLINTGDGTFQPHKDFATGVKPQQLIVADFNGDLKPDVAVVNF